MVQIAKTLSSRVVGLVMAGGLSSRMGHDKAAISFDYGCGKDLLTRSLDILQAVLGEVYVVGREHADFPFFRDDETGLGPVGGITTGLRQTGAACFVLSCDLPFMTKKVVEQLLDFRAKQAADTLMCTYLQVETGFVEPLVAIYEPQALPYFQEASAKRLLKINRIVPAHTHRYLPYGTAGSLPFFNLNYPADLEMAKWIMQSQRK